MWKVFMRDVGNFAFLHTYKKLLDELLLDIDLGFTTVSDVRSRSGSPQGLKVSLVHNLQRLRHQEPPITSGQIQNFRGCLK